MTSSGSLAPVRLVGRLGARRNEPELPQVEADRVTRDRDRFGFAGGLTSNPPRQRIGGRPVLNQEDDHGKDDG